MLQNNGRVSSNLLIALDESNHGRNYPEIRCATFSTHPQDSKIHKKPMFEKKSRTDQCLFANFSSRDYSFLYLFGRDFEMVAPRDLWGVVSASLSYDNVRENVSEFKIFEYFIDGENKGFDNPIRTKDIISEMIGVEKERVRVTYKAKLDELMFIANLSDNMAHYWFRKGTPKRIGKNPHQKGLLINKYLR